MLPLVVLVVAFVVFWLVGLAGVAWFHPWTHAARAALACMLLLTASGRLLPKIREELVAMVPPQFPRPEVLVVLSGILEAAGAAGLILEATHRMAALCLVLMFLVMFPANIYAARKHLTIQGKEVPGIVPRTGMQIVFIAAAVASAF
jgi:uncharacterized membrane protein